MGHYFFAGILEDIRKTIQATHENIGSDILKDIHDGELYKEQNPSTEHTLNGAQEIIKLTAVLNTDGVNLYSSSKVELWPVFVSINELSPTLRFSRDNILLLGLWQGKGKPPFKAYFKCISEEINYLTVNGVDIDEEVHVHLSVLGVTVDLPAKASLLNMTYYNGAEACITCEEPGKTVTQGHGHSRCYPYRPSESRYPIRSSENVLQLMNVATDRNRQKGFKGESGLANLSKFDMVFGTAPDYMHCILLGIVKTLMCKWFSPQQSGKDYFVGKDLKQISKRLLMIKPPYFIERLPRDLEKHYNHFKATELQAFLLFYCMPCLHGYLAERFLQHFALLSEAIHILLGENITQERLEKSEFLLERFYSQFSELYGEGSCGLNVHNACLHMPMYVKKLGPLWAWSCFAFEDANAMILQSVHGTGNVVKQALRKQEVSMYIRSSEEVATTSKTKLKVTYKAQNCDVLGALQPVKRLPTGLTESLGVVNVDHLRKIQRVVVNGEKFYCHEYSRMKRRNCHAVLYSGDNFGLIQYFVLVKPTNKVYAVLRKVNSNADSWLCTFEAAKHLIPVVLTDSYTAVSVDHLSTTLLFMEMENPQEAIVAKMPNRLGHAVLK